MLLAIWINIVYHEEEKKKPIENQKFGGKYFRTWEQVCFDHGLKRRLWGAGPVPQCAWGMCQKFNFLLWILIVLFFILKIVL